MHASRHNTVDKAGGDKVCPNPKSSLHVKAMYFSAYTGTAQKSNKRYITYFVIHANLSFVLHHGTRKKKAWEESVRTKQHGSHVEIQAEEMIASEVPIKQTVGSNDR